jgi:predicted transcriptional regulator
MHFNITLDDRAGAQISHCAEATGKSRDALIREAVDEWLARHGETWPEEILAFQGVADFPAFEAARSESAAPLADPLA